MRARDIAVPQPTVTLHDSVADAVRILTGSRLPGLIVVDEPGRPLAVLPGTQVLRMAVLDTYQQDPALARAIDESHADHFWQDRAGLTVGRCLPTDTTRPGTVSPDATLLEVAVLMALAHSPLVAVVDATGRLAGAITLNVLLAKLDLPGRPS